MLNNIMKIIFVYSYFLTLLNFPYITGLSSVFTTVCSEVSPVELPDLLVQCPTIERIRVSEGSFGSINLSPADISLVNGKNKIYFVVEK